MRDRVLEPKIRETQIVKCKSINESSVWNMIHSILNKWIKGLGINSEIANFFLMSCYKHFKNSALKPTITISQFAKVFHVQLLALDLSVWLTTINVITRDGKVDRTKASSCPQASSHDLAFYVSHFSKKSPVHKGTGWLDYLSNSLTRDNWNSGSNNRTNVKRRRLNWNSSSFLISFRRR